MYTRAAVILDLFDCKMNSTKCSKGIDGAKIQTDKPVMADQLHIVVVDRLQKTAAGVTDAATSRSSKLPSAEGECWKTWDK